ncbi:DUF1206 domain-containing protein [Thalassobacillus devorans]|uniref:DUF1206 domain-containing protein n=1 Tax=Thalassobacillus devorans TaxID=279813 RepID=UPI00048CE88E|nr:DUF1206 domain-containing protein [Thalassobacillus devorans]
MDTTQSMSNKNEVSKEDIKPWIRRMARAGYMAKGLVYALIGVLAFMAAIGVGGKTTGTSGMFRSIAQVPAGNVILWLIGLGLILYIMWVLIKAFKDPQNEGSDLKGMVTRTGYFVSGVIYGALAFKAFKIAINAGSGSGGSQDTLSAKLLSQPFGAWILGAIGVITIGYGLFELIIGTTQKFLKNIRTIKMSDHEIRIARNAGTAGLTARGIVLGIIGFFIVRTAMTHNPSKAKGLDGALAEVAQKPFGQWLLGVVALGLILYGLYQIIRGRYEQMMFGRVK